MTIDYWMQGLWGIVFICCSLSVSGQDKQYAVAEIAVSKNVPAIQLLYSKGGTRESIVYGLRNSAEVDAINAETAFQAASLTKVLTAYTFFRLMDRRQIDLDAPLWNYYHYDRLENHPQKEKITARMVLTHRSGLLNWEGNVPSDSWRKTPLTMQFAPGTDYMYSGEGFYFLQETMEHITGKTFQQLVEDEVLIPFGMHHSEIIWKDRLAENAAYGHDVSGEPMRLGKYTKANAAYTLYTTATDYERFVRKFVLEGFGLKPETHRLALQKAGDVRRAEGAEVDDQYVPCALGLRMQLNEEGTAYWHTGSNPGFRDFFMVYPQQKEILVFFTNSEGGFRVIPDLLTLFLPKNQTFWAYTWRQGELD